MRLSSATALVLALLAAMAIDCNRRPETAGTAEVLRLQDGNVRLYRQQQVYTYRRNNWFFYACGDALRRDSRRVATPGQHRILVHIDAHSDAHPAPPAVAPESLHAASLAALEAYTARLSIGSYVFPLLHYGFVDEIYWVQPALSCYQGPEETVRFALEAREGRIVPRLRANARPVDADSLTARAFRGEPVARSQDLACAYGHETRDWEPGPGTLHCLSFEQFDRHVRAGDLGGQAVLVDLDLDYFGAGGPLHGYGYLLLPRHGHVALGLRGGALPVFSMTPDEREAELRRVGDLLARLRPQMIGISESPEHSHREDLPALVASLRAHLWGGRPATVPGVQVRVAGARSEALTATCEQYVDLGESQTPRLEIEWEPPRRDSLDVSLYADPAGSRDRLMARWRVEGEGRRLTLPLRVPAAGLGTLLGPGWDVEVRRACDGALLYSAGFTLDAGGELMRRIAGAEALGDPAHYLALDPPGIIAEGRARALPPELTHQILVAHPRALEAQCHNLSAFRAGATSGRRAP